MCGGGDPKRLAFFCSASFGYHIFRGQRVRLDTRRRPREAMMICIVHEFQRFIQASTQASLTCGMQDLVLNTVPTVPMNSHTVLGPSSQQMVDSDRRHHGLGQILLRQSMDGMIVASALDGIEFASSGRA